MIREGAKAGPVILLSLLVALAASGCARRGSDLGTKFQAALSGFQERYGFPGATAAFALSDGTVGTAAAGLADKESGRPMTADSRMPAASIGKTFVGAIAVALELEGAMDLDDPLSRWLGDRPWFGRLPNHDKITLRHLVTHTSGLPDHVHLDRFAAAISRSWRAIENPFSPEDLVQFVLDLPPLFEPGRGWAYTDTGYILLGLVIEKAARREYYQLVQERFLSRFELTLTAPADRRAIPGLAAGYVSADNALRFPAKTTTADGALAWHPGFEWTGGGLVSNPRDLARWGTILFEGKAMPEPYLDKILFSVPISPASPDTRYGAGVGIYRTGPFGPVYGHGGWIPGYCSSLRYYPDFGVAIAFQINTDIGVMEDTASLLPDMEKGLAAEIISAVRRRLKGR